MNKEHSELEEQLSELVLKFRNNGYWDDALLELEPHNREFVDSTSWAGELHWEAMQRLHVAEILNLIQTSNKEIETAYGGCHKCYGKGYATTIDYSTGGRMTTKNPIMRYCTCERGEQLEKLNETSNKEARNRFTEVVSLYGTPTCNNLHHPKEYRHNAIEDCPVEKRIKQLKQEEAK